MLRQTGCKSLEQHASSNPSAITRALPRPKTMPVWAERMLEKLESGEFIETAAITDVMGAILAGVAPFVLWLEDIHEVAPGQLEFICALARRVQRLKGVGLIVTSRQEPPEPFEAVRLEALSFDAVRRMLEHEAGADLPAECLGWIHQRAAGNALFSLEFFRALARQGAVWNDGKRWRWRTPEGAVMPVTVEALIEHQLLSALDAPTLQAVASAKAMLPVGAEESLWVAVSGCDFNAVQDAKDELEQPGVLNAGEFAHPLYLEIQRQSLSPERRRTFARRAIEALKTEHPAEVVAFLDEAAFEPQQTLDLLERAMNNTSNETHLARLRAHASRYATGEARKRLALEAARTLAQVDVRQAERL